MFIYLLIYLSGSLLHTLTGCTRDVMCVSFNMTGSMVLGGSNDNIIHLWEPETGRQRVSDIDYSR
jgi:WD40 repeat protein